MTFTHSLRLFLLVLYVDSILICSKVQSFKFIPLVYQIASRMGNAKDGHGHLNFQVVVSPTLYMLYLFLVYNFLFNMNMEYAVCIGFSCEENGH